MVLTRGHPRAHKTDGAAKGVTMNATVEVLRFCFLRWSPEELYASPKNVSEETLSCCMMENPRAQVRTVKNVL